MKFNCVHTFTIEARDRAEFEERLHAYSRKVTAASAKLTIGYANGCMWGNQAASDRPNLEPEEVERLFND